MDKYKYYTPTNLAESLIKLLPKKDYKNIIDICCGSWNLLKAAQKLYPNANFVGVDVDKNAYNHKIANSCFFNSDGRKFAIIQNRDQQFYDLILSNPPFGYLEENQRVFKSFETQYVSLNNKRYENEMVQANLMLAHENSVIIFILPNTFVEGITNIKVRMDIAKDYSISSIIKLPDNTFGSRKICTYAVIMLKGVDETNTKFYNAMFNNEWELKLSRNISYKNITDGNWTNERPICKISALTYRGNVSSSLFRKTGKKVIHCSNLIINNKWIPTIKYCKPIDDKLYKQAKKGDILVNRIGKYAGYWTINDIDNVLVSDCIIVISNYNEEMINKLNRNTINGRISIPLRGVSTKYITAIDIQSVLYA